VLEHREDPPSSQQELGISRTVKKLYYRGVAFKFTHEPL